MGAGASRLGVPALWHPHWQRLPRIPLGGAGFLPTVDAGQFRLHVRAATGTRIEKTETIFSDVEDEIRRIIPAQEIKLILDNFGVVSEKYSLAFGDNSTIGSHDGEIIVQLNHERTKTTPEYMEEVRRGLRSGFPISPSSFSLRTLFRRS